MNEINQLAGDNDSLENSQDNIKRALYNLNDPAKEYLELSNAHEESFQSIAQELGDDESIRLHNAAEMKYKHIRVHPKQTMTNKKDNKNDLCDKLVPVIIVKPSKSVCSPSIAQNGNRKITKSNISESDSTRSDKFRKESFESYSATVAHQKLNYNNKNLQIKVPFQAGKSSSIRKFSNEVGVHNKANNGYY